MRINTNCIWKLCLLACSVTITSNLFAQGQFSVSANFRARSEYRDGARILLDDTQKPSFVSSQRTRLITDYQLDQFEFRFAIQNARIWGVDDERANIPNLNLAEGYVKYYFNEDKDKFNIKVGRQHLVLDDGRIFGMRNWNDIAVSHDLALLEYNDNDWSVKTGGGYNNDSNKFSESAYEVNYYKYLALLWANKQINKNLGVSVLTSVDGNENPDDFEEIYPRFTSGVYVKGGNKGTDFGVQAAFYYQYGKNPAGLQQKAFMYSVIPTYKFNEKLRGAIGYNFFSGNDQLSTNTTTNRAFNKLFGDGHRYYGYMDYFLNIESNTKGGGMKNLFGSLYFRTSKKSELEFSFHNFEFGGTFMDTETLGAATNQLGNEIDIQYIHKFNNFFSVRVDYSAMFAQQSMELIKGGDHERHQQWATVMLIAKPELFSSIKKD